MRHCVISHSQRLTSLLVHSAQWYRIGPRGCFVIARRQASVSQRELTAPKWIEVISTASRQGALLDPQGGSAPTYQLLLLLKKIGVRPLQPQAAR